MENKTDKTFGIAIIESLSATDKKTGTILHDEVLKSVRFENFKINTSFYSANNRTEFFKALIDILKKIKNNEFIPILQIETHGFEDGIRLQSTETITWKELLNETRKINILLKNKLALFICACEGNSIIGAIDPSERAPFRFLISSYKKLYPVEILNAFEEFYNSFFNAVPMTECVQRMNNIINADKPLFCYITSGQCFESMISLNRDNNNLDGLINEIAVKEKESNPEYKDVEFMLVRQKVEEKVRLFIKSIEKERDYFEMNDLQ